MKYKDTYGTIDIKTRNGSEDDKAVFKEIFKENVYQLTNQMFTGGIVLDIGANIGVFTIEAMRRAKHNGLPITVIAVEPEPHNLALLKRNIEKNSFINEKAEIYIVEKAIGATNGLVNISNNHGGSKIGETGTEVQMITLDDLFKEFDIKEVDLAKVDIEGSEVPALLNATESNIDKIKHAMIEFDESATLEDFSKLVQVFGRKCSLSTLGVPARGCYLYTERHIK